MLPWSITYSRIDFDLKVVVIRIAVPGASCTTAVETAPEPLLFSCAANAFAQSLSLRAARSVAEIVASTVALPRGSPYSKPPDASDDQPAGSCIVKPVPLTVLYALAFAFAFGFAFGAEPTATILNVGFAMTSFAGSDHD